MHEARDLRKAANAPVPKDVPAALAWLYRIFALLTSLFRSDLPELADLGIAEDDPQADPRFTVVVWTSAHAQARAVLPALLARVNGSSDRLGDPSAEPDVVYWLDVLDQPDRLVVVDHRTSLDPADVDYLIADMATSYPGHGLTLRGPGLALRLTRKARRAALARVRRAFRREARAELRGQGRPVRSLKRYGIAA